MNTFVGVAVFSSQVLLQVPEPWIQSYGAGASMVLASKPKHCYIGWDIVRGDETAPQGVLGRGLAFTLFGCRIPSTVELAAADIVCADVMKGRPTSYQT
jgi:hypothetical protein